jgi:hypothetical protein
MLRRNQRGQALIEIVPILVLFVLLLNFALGFFGVIHTGILNSIAARNYTFETFRNRADLSYFREEQPGSNSIPTFAKFGRRWHGIVENSTNFQWVAVQRALRFTEARGPASEGNTATFHNTKVWSLQDGKKVSDQGMDEPGEGSNPVWLKNLYGICLRASCTEAPP